jgi:hypothetical protein
MLFSLRPLFVHLFLPVAVGLRWCQALASLPTVTTAAHRAAIRPATLRITDITTVGSKRCIKQALSFRCALPRLGAGTSV